MLQRLPATEVWTQWTGEVVDGLFPLESCIGSSDHSGVYLTENPARNAAKAALKLVPALPASAGLQLARWNTAAGLDHPHLVRLLHTGRCQLAESQYLYVVMESADQNLAELLLRRALTQEEAWELLPPILDALAFLHRRHLVQGHLQPSNILAVGNTLMLSSDTICGVGQVARSNRRPSAYDPPETSGSTAGDIWALGVTLAECFTQAHPSGTLVPGGEPVLPRDFPPTFADAVRRCLSYEPTERPSVADLKAWMKVVEQQAVDASPPAADVATMRESAVRRAPARRAIKKLPDNTAPKQRFSRRWSLAFLVVVSNAIQLACWVVVFVLRGPGPTPLAAVAPVRAAPPAQPVVLPAAVPKVAEAQNPVEGIKDPPQTSSLVPPNTDADAVKPVASPSVLHEEIPKVPRAAREIIQGDIQVIVRVTVDSSGTVREVLTDPRSSAYFAQLATDAARNWKFAQAPDQPSRQWLVRFVFSRAGTAARSIPMRPRVAVMSQ